MTPPPPPPAPGPVAVWSLWTAPLRGGSHPGWATPRHHLLSWVLSFRLAREHFRRTALVTDSAGAALLVDGLGLGFDAVSTALDALDGWDPDWWAIAKLHACAAQPGPFLHLDSDVFLWRPLPGRLLAAPVCAQHPETGELGASAYRPERVEHAVRRAGGWLPEEFAAWVPHGGRLRAPNCGILGGTAAAFLRHFAGQALRFIGHPDNQAAWGAHGVGGGGEVAGHAIVFEQLLLGACVDYHAGRAGSPFADVGIEYLFESAAAAAGGGEAAGYTHLVAGAKRDAAVLDGLERAVARRWPEDHARVRALA